MKGIFEFLILCLTLLLSPAGVFAATDKLIVGVNLPLTGDVAEYGVAVRNGIEMARKEQPGLFEDIDFLYGDNRYDGRTALTVFHSQHDVQKAKLSFVW